MSQFRSVVLVVGVMGLVACGGGGNDEGEGRRGGKLSSKKEVAALAFGLQSADSAAKGTRSKGKSNSNKLGTSLAKKATQGPETVECINGGKLTAAYEADTTNLPAEGFDGTNSGEILAGAELTFSNCVVEYDDPETDAVESDELTFDGELLMAVLMRVEGTQVGIVTQTNADLTLEGVIEDTFKSELTQDIFFDGAEETPRLAVVLDGTVKTSEETFTFDQESHEFSEEAMSGFVDDSSGDVLTGLDGSVEDAGYEY